MKKMMVLFALFAVAAIAARAEDEVGQFVGGDYKSGIPWKTPAVVTPGDTPCAPPSDAIVLFDGTNMDAWEGGNWNVADGVMTVEPSSGSIKTKQKFGSVQLHVEFATPPVNKDENGNPVDFGQARGNSGIFLMDHYEVQVLDSFGNETYPDGQCGSIYKQVPPQVNVCKAPGEWQSYDIVFTRPILRIEGDEVVEVIRPAYITVFQNGVLVINHWAIQGETYFHRTPNYIPIEDKEPIQLQDHHNRMQFRNIWVREIPDSNVIPAQDKIQHYE